MLRKWKTFCIAAIAIVLAFDLMAAIAIIFLDSSKSYKNITTYKNCSVECMVKKPGYKLVVAKCGYRVFEIETKKSYDEGDKIDIEEIDTIGFFSHFVLEREWKIKK